MELNFNPYQNFSERYLLKRLKQTEKMLWKISSGKPTKTNPDVTRMLFLSISDALHRKKHIDLMNEMFGAEYVNSDETDGE